MAQVKTSRTHGQDRGVPACSGSRCGAGVGFAALSPRLTLCLAMAMAGCGADAVRVDESDSGGGVVLETNQELVVTLPSNPSTGYAWSYELTAPGVIEAVGSEYRPTRPVLPGSGGHESFRFVAVRSGRTLLRLEYRRSWETDTPPEQTVSFDVAVQ